MLEKLVEAFSLLESLEGVSSRNVKKEILKQGAGNEYFLDMLRLAYDPFLKFNIYNYGDVTPSGSEVKVENFKKFKLLLENLSKSMLTGNEALSTVNLFFESLTEREYKWYSRILRKDLRVGVNIKTINSVFKKLVPVFECMLAESWEEIKKKPKEVILEPKFDGYRAVCFVNKDGSVEIFTRNGKPIIGFKAIEKELAQLTKGMVYDGEIIGKHREFADMQELVFNKEVKEKQGTLMIFDVLPIEEFKQGESTKTLIERKQELVAIFSQFTSDDPEVSLFEHLRHITGSEVFSSEDEEAIQSYYEAYIDHGYEGLMIKDAHSKYVCKRSKAWAKWKPFETGDFEIIGSYEGKGKYERMLGGFIIDFEGNPVEVGSGFTDEERKEFWEKRNELVGKVIEVQYKGETTNKKGTRSLRWPTFKGFRHDKS